MDAFIENLKDSHNVIGNRIAAKALVYMTANDSQLKARVVSEISDDIKRAAMDKHDSVVGAHLRVLLN